jgi:hypothetical protein
MTSNVRRSVVCLVLLLAVLSMTTLAANKNRIGTAGAQELLIPVGARGVAMGFSGSIFIKGVDAVYWNPAGLSRMGGSVEAMFSQMSYIADIGVSYGAIGVSAGDFGHLGFSIKSLSFGDIPVTTELYPDGTGATYSPTFLTMGVTYSRLLTDRISVGVTGYVVSEKIMSVSASGFCFDVGVQYQNLGIQGLALSIGIKNIGPNMTFDGSGTYTPAVAVDDPLRGQQTFKTELAPFEMPSNLEIAIGYSPKLDDKNAVSIGGAFRNNNFLEDEYNLGAEYSFMDLLSVRGGYTFSPQTENDPTGENSYIYDWTAGAGVHKNLGGVDLTFDYAYRNVKYFSGSHVLTFKVGF